MIYTRHNILGIFSIFALVWSVTAYANVTNTVPYTNTFEQYSHSTQLLLPPVTNGWYCEPGVSNDAATVSTNWANWTNGYTGLIPFPSATHSNVLQLTDTVTNIITQPAPNQDVFIDLMLKPTMWASSEYPAIDPFAKFAIFFDTNMNPVVYASNATNLSTFTGPKQWLALTNFTVSTTEWVRVTVLMDWGTAGAFGIKHDWFLLKLNGVEIIDDRGFSEVRNSLKPGTWFVCATNSPDILSGIGFMGNSLIDDMQVSTNDPLNIKMYSVNLTVTPPNSAQIFPGGTKSTDTRSYPSNSVSGPAFTFNSLTNYSITNTCINGTNYLGASVTNFTFPNITQNCSVVVMSRGDDRGVIVSNVSTRAGLNPSGYGTYFPSGSNTYAYNTPASFTIAGSPQAVNVHTQIVCIGWNATGSGEAIGYVTNNNFTVVNYTTLTWKWDYQYWLSSTIYGHGYITPSNGWFTHGSTIQLTAYGYPPDGVFSHWSGETNDCTILDNVITITSWTGPRNINAHFSGGATARGTDYDYLIYYYPTNYQMEVAEEWDTDGDGFKTWEEYITGTDPTDAASKFRIISTGIGTNGSNFVTFYGTTNSGVVRPFGMRLITNMLSSTNWINWTPMEETFIDRSGDGTNTFWYSPGPGTNMAYYIPVATN